MKHRISCVMVSLLASSAADCGMSLHHYRYGNNLMAQHWQIIGMVGKRLPLALQQWPDVGPTYLHQL
jgi:hypothetical protein